MAEPLGQLVEIGADLAHHRSHGGQGQLGLSAREVVIKHTFGCAGRGQQFVQPHAVITPRAQGIQHGGDEAFAGAGGQVFGRHGNESIDQSV